MNNRPLEIASMVCARYLHCYLYVLVSEPGSDFVFDIVVRF